MRGPSDDLTLQSPPISLDYERIYFNEIRLTQNCSHCWSRVRFTLYFSVSKSNMLQVNYLEASFHKFLSLLSGFRNIFQNTKEHFSGNLNPNTIHMLI